MHELLIPIRQQLKKSGSLFTLHGATPFDLQSVHNQKNICFTRCQHHQYFDIRNRVHPFTKCELLLFDACDKNFFYHLFRPSYFPNVKQILINNHPCDYDIHQRFRKQDKNNQQTDTVPQIFVTIPFKRYFQLKSCIGFHIPPVQYIDPNDFNEMHWIFYLRKNFPYL